MNPKAPVFLPSSALVAAAAISGLFWIPLREVYAEGVTPFWATFLTAVLSFAGALLLIAMPPRRKTGALGPLLFAGLLVGTAFTTYIAALLTTDVVRALLLFYIAPAWGTLLEIAVLRQRLTLRRVLALILAIAGLVVILDSDIGIPLPHNVGDWLAFASGWCWAIGGLLNHRLKVPDVRLQTASVAFGGMVASIAMLLLLGAGESVPALPALEAAGSWLLLLGIGLTLPMYMLAMYGLQSVGPGRATLIFMAEVCIGVASAALLIPEEPFGWRQIAGTILVLSSAAVELLPIRGPAGRSSPAAPR